MMAAHTEALRRELVALLRGGAAHASLDEIFGGVAPEARARRAEGFDHTIWQLAEHLRLAQKDILNYMIDPTWESPPWPDGYWPEGGSGGADSFGAPTEDAWRQSLDGIRADLHALLGLLDDPALDVTAALPHAPEHTYLREFLLVADHNSYHLGQIVQLRKALGDWSR